MDEQEEEEEDDSDQEEDERHLVDQSELGRPHHRLNVAGRLAHQDDREDGVHS